MTLPAVRGVWSLLWSLTFVSATAAIACAQEELPPEIDSDGVQTLTRGPVHEAFASPTVADPEPGFVVPKAPPADIREQPPEFQPDGQNVQWFPGYWAWDEDREDYIWVSGAWRDPPPGKRWVPGYWAVVTGGFQWVSGFWIDEAVEEMEYLKPPPESLEQGPPAAAPADNYFYIPGTWTYANNDYVWVAGYYAPYREDWVYVPPHWVWTPRGYIFVAGYWDWRLPRRGQIFAPVYMTPAVYAAPTYYYRPRCVINTSTLFVHLWVRPSYCHYYFGNYYGPTYAHRHFTPWCNYTISPRCHDPLFTYCNVHYHRQGINYTQRMQSWHAHYVNHANERPPTTWHDQLDRQHHNHQPGIQNAHHASFLAQDMKDVIHSPEKAWKRQDVAAKDHTRASIEQTKQLHQLRLDHEKMGFVSRDVPGRDRDPGDRNDRPNRSPNIGDKPHVPDLKLPGNGPVANAPAGNNNAAQPALGDKVKLPRPALTNHLSPHKPRVEVPEAPEKTMVSRPITGQDRIDLPRTGIGQNNGPKIPDLNSPGNGIGNNLTNQPRHNDTRDDKKPNLSGHTSSSVQQKIDAIRQQQQDALNKARNRTNDVVGPQVGPNLGGNPTRTETPRVQTPKIDIPKIETPRRDTSPRSLTPTVQPRNSTPNVQPRSLVPTPSPTPSPRVTPQVTPRHIPAPTPQITPRHHTPAPAPHAAPKHEAKPHTEKKHSK